MGQRTIGRDDSRAADQGGQSGFFFGIGQVGKRMRNKGTWLSLGSIISLLGLLMLFRCGGDGGAGGIIGPPPTSEAGYIDGVVYDARSDLPLEGAWVTARGASGSVKTDGEGKFFFPIVKNREYILTIEEDGYAYAQRRARGVVGRDVAVDPVYLIPLDPNATPIGPEGGTHTDSTGRIEIVFPPGAMSRTVDVRATMVERDKELPYPLPPLSKFTVALNLKPDSLVLNKPATVRIENFLGFPPGTPVPVGIYTKETAQWTAYGMGVVTADGSTMEYETTHFSFGDCNFPVFPPADSGVLKGIEHETPEEVHRCEEDGVTGSAKVGLKTGNLYLANGFPRYRSLGIWRGVTLEYNSLSAKPGVVIAAEAEVDPAQIAIPETIGFRVNIEGIRREVKFEGDEGEARFAFHFDGRNARGHLLPTGTYPFRVDISGDYRGNYYTAAFFGGPPLEDTGVSSRETFPLNNYYYGWLPLHNESHSPYGSGWGVRGLGRLYVDPQGEAVLLTKGSTYAGVFVPVGTYHEMEPNCVLFLGGIGIDRRDQLYFTSKAYVWRRNPDGPLTVVAGNGEIGFGGDGGPAIEAMLWTPMDVAFDSQGNMYIADTGNERIRKVDAFGIITTYAGSGEPGFGGDGGLATEAKLLSPTGVAVDSSGNLYIADRGNNRIRVVGPSGIINTYAGSGPPGFGGDGGPATEARLYSPNDIALDSEGNLFIADTANNRIRRVGNDGIITTVAGTGIGGFSGNGGAAVNAQIWSPYDVAVDPAGNLYIADYTNWRIRRMDTNGIINTWVGGARGYTVDGMPAPDARIFPPHAITLDSRGTLYIGQVPPFGQCYPVCKVDVHALGEPHEVLFDSPRGDSTKLRQNADLSFTRTLKDGTEIHFDQRGFHVKTIDLNQNVTLYGYDDQDRLKTITDPKNQITRFEYENDGKLSRIIDPAQRETLIDIDEAGDLRATIDPTGAETRFTYQDHLLVTSIDPQGYPTHYVYDPAYDRVAEVHYPTGEVRSFSHSDIQGLINDLPPGLGTPENPAPIVRVETIRDSFSDGERKTWTFLTDRFGHIIEREDPIGRVTLVERDLDSLPTRVELPNGEVFRITWDERGNPTLIYQESIDATTTLNYYPVHNKIEYIRDAENRTTHLEYNDQGNLTDFWDAESNYYHLTYYEGDGGLLKTVTNPLRKTTTFTYNELGNLETITDPLDHTMTFGYDDAGNIDSVTDANDNTTTYRYDDMNRLIVIIDAEENFTQYGYDEGFPEKGSRGLLSSIIDGRDNTTTFKYDGVMQLRGVIQPLGQTKTFDYYLNRNLKSITTPNGDLITFIYDDSNQLMEKRLPEGTVYYDYDAVGNLTSVDNGASVINMAYDLAGRLGSVETALTAHQPAIAIAYEEYDKVGNRLTMNDGAGTTTYVYNKINLVTDLTSPLGHTGYTYDGLGRRETGTLPNEIVVSFTFDDAGRLVNLTNEGMSSFDYTPDDVGNWVSMTTGDGPHGYTYDDIYELTIATHPLSPTESYTYDDVGNRKSSREHPDWRYDDNNRLTSYNGTAYTHDENGNTVTKTDASGTTTYTYDSENKLTRIDFPAGGFVEYVYDGLGRRIEKNVNGTITRYVYDLEDILFEYDGSNTITARYTHGPGIDDLIGVEGGGQNYFYHTDGLGNITQITDSSKQIVTSYSYDAFGNITSQTGALTNPYIYTAREYDPESGLHYYRARYYDPKIGRFLQPDLLDMAMVILLRQYLPGGFIGRLLYQHSLKNPLLVSNLYPYVGNNPINRNDPVGLWYIDVNVSLGYWGGGTGGIIIKPEKLYLYGGGGFVTPPGGVAITVSPMDPTSGWNVGLQGGKWLGGQIGYGFGEDGGVFLEGGFVTPGVSLTGFHVWGPWKWPWQKDACK